MANEEEWNVLFVQKVEKHTCLYDITSPSYIRTDKKERAWEDIA
jgi:hypothetical protein